MTEYHRAAIGRAWWRSPLELVLVVVLWFVAASIVAGVAMAAAGAKNIDELDNLSTLFLALTTMATLVPATMLAARIVGRKPGLLSSTLGRLRKSWLVRCVATAIVVNLVWLGVYIVIGLIVDDHAASSTSADTASTATRGGSNTLLQSLGIIALTVPLQAAGEEYFFRGTVMQLVGRFAKPWWIAGAISAVSFTAVHGALNTASTALFAMGAVFAWLTVRTGGLEAAIAQHVVNNLLVFTLLMLAGGGGHEIQVNHINEGATWGAVASQTATLVVYSALIAWQFKRRQLPAQASSAQRAAAVADQIEENAAERRVSVQHPDHGGDAEALPPEQQKPRG
jgi:membrane protease YdiL (CAAX protease family)